MRELLRRRQRLLKRRRFASPAETVSAVARVEDGRFVVDLGRRSFFVDPGYPPDPEAPSWDFALFGLAAISMTNNIAIEFENPVSEGAARALDRLRRNFAIWNIIHLAPLRVTPRAVVPDPGAPATAARAVCLSGGIDSTAAAIEARDLHGFTHGMLIAGADYPSAKNPGFIELRERVGAIAGLLGLDLLVTETSIRRTGFYWEMLFGVNLLMCLHAQNGRLGGGGVGLDFSEVQDLTMYPWGSSHALISGASTGHMEILSLNRAIGRTEKLRRIVECDPRLAEMLSVCWEDTTSGGNCGTCLKCQRTKLNFIGAIGEIPDIFRQNPPLEDFVRNLRVPKKFSGVRTELVQIDDIYQELPDGELRDLVGRHLQKLRDAHTRRSPLP